MEHIETSGKLDTQQVVRILNHDSLVRRQRLSEEGRRVKISAFSGKKFPQHVLVVDDEALIRWSIAQTLAEAGWEVSEAANAKEALQRLAGDPTPDVILLDYRLPDSNDLTLLEKIRQIVPTSAVVMMTAYGTPAMQAGALALGAHRVVNKPVEMRDLLPLVQGALEARQLER